MDPAQKTHKRRIFKLTQSPSYRKAFEDVEFLKSEHLRPVRLQLELLKPEVVLNKGGIKATIVIFGSARIPEPAMAKRRLKRLEREWARRPNNKALAFNLAVAKKILENAKYYNEARRFSKLVSQYYRHKGVTIATGGGPGIMEAANRGASDAKAKSVGLNITVPREQYPNPYITPEFCFRFHYFAIRKMHFLLRAKALVVFPGGFGTLDELFETLTLIQTGKIEHFPVILVGTDYWSRVIDFPHMVAQGVIAPEDLSLFHLVNTADEAFLAIKKSIKIT